MILFVLVGVVIVVGVVVAGALGGVFTSDDRARGFGGTGSLVGLLGGGFLVVVGGAALLVGIGVSGGDDEATGGEPSWSASTTSTVVDSTTSPPTSEPPSPAATESTDLSVRTVAVHVSVGDEFTPPPSVLDRLPARTVLRVSATGFEPLSTGVIEQCTTGGCGNAFPVSFDESGNELLQYLAQGDFSVDGTRASCGPDAPPCVVRVSSSGAAVYVTTVFGGAAPAARSVSIDTPTAGVADGDAVDVSVTGFTPGERVQAMLCAAPATFGAARCGAPGPVAPFSIASDGTGHTSLVVDRGRVGTDGVACGRDARCGVVVASAGTHLPAPVAPITFAAGPTVSYDVTRVLLGLLVAAFLLALATYLVRTTDWRKPTEADTPALDSAVL